jgi:TatD DNase family protein
MIPFIDVHCHLDYLDNKKVNNVIQNAKKKNVIIVNTGINVKSNRKTIEISKKYPEVKYALGIYPIDALSLSDEEIDEEIKFIQKNKDNLIAIGEVGLDLKEKGIETLEKQKKNLKKFFELAKKIDKPIIVHSRKAEKETVEFLESLNAKKVVMHCFSGNMNLVKRIVENGWFLSIPASINNSTHFQQVVKDVNANNLLCETDSPFLHPEKLKDNEPVNVIVSYKKISEIKEIDLESVKKIIYDNYKNLFE